MNSQPPPTISPLTLDARTLNAYADADFPDCRAAIADFQEHLAGLGADDLELISTLLLQRESRAFTPRLAGEHSGKPYFISAPFLPFYIFDTIEAFNFARGVDFAWRHALRGKPYTTTVLKGVHALVTDGKAHAGKLRDRGVWIGERFGGIEKARMIMVEHDRVPSALRLLARASFGPNHALCACALIHLQVVTIHPFVDGNGRVVRAITPALLRYGGIVSLPGLYIGEEFLQRRSQASTRASAAQRDGELDAWVLFFADALASQARRSKAFAARAHRIKSELSSFLAGAAETNEVHALVEHALLSPTLSASTIRKLLRTSKRSAQRFVLRGTGIYGFSQVTDGDDPLYQFRDIFEAFAL